METSPLRPQLPAARGCPEGQASPSAGPLTPHMGCGSPDTLLSDVPRLRTVASRSQVRSHVFPQVSLTPDEGRPTQPLFISPLAHLCLMYWSSSSCSCVSSDTAV